MNAKQVSLPQSAATQRRLARASSRRIRLLIVDDHDVVREGLRAMLRPHADMQVVAVAHNGRLAVDLWREHHPDVTLLDLRLPEFGGLEALEEIRKQDAAARARAIVLTTFDNDEDIYRAMRGGAKAYLLKDVTGQDLVTCIRKVAAGECVVSPTIAARLAVRLSGQELTDRENEVLALLVHGLSNKEIAARLFIGETTVKSHLKQLFAKMHVMSRTEAIATAIQRGLVRL